MKKQNKENFKSIINSLENGQKTLFICSSNEEIDYIHSKLLNDISKTNIVRFYDREILPYDHFSTPDDVIKNRIDQLLKLKDANLILTSLKNTFEFYPDYEFYDSLKTFKTGDKLTISELKDILELLNYKRVEKVSSLNEYSHRGGIVDINSSRYKNPLRIDFFGDNIDSIREFNIKTQRSISEINRFRLNSGYEIPLSKDVIDDFKEKWRDEFPDTDERTSSFFCNLNKKNLPEGYENFLSILIKEPKNFFTLVNCDQIYISNSSNIKNYNQFIIERFQDENNGSRELIAPSRLFFNVQDEIRRLDICLLYTSPSPRDPM